MDRIPEVTIKGYKIEQVFVSLYNFGDITIIAILIASALDILRLLKFGPVKYYPLYGRYQSYGVHICTGSR